MNHLDILVMAITYFCTNQFAPLDTAAAMDTFISYWKPKVIMIMESELWPNLILGASQHGVSCHIIETYDYLDNAIVLC